MIRFLLALLLATFAVSTVAQMPGRGSRGGAPGMGAPGQRVPTDRFRPNDSSAPTQVQLDALEDDLKLTDTQRPAWYAYADRVQKFADTTARLRSEARTRAMSGNAIDQLDRISQEQHERQATLEEIRDLGRAFYSTLTSEQKAIADRRLALPVASIMGAATVVPEGARGGSPR